MSSNYSAPQIGLDYPFVRLDLRRSAFCDDLAVVQHSHAFADIHHYLHLMLNQEYSEVESVTHVKDKLHQLLSLCRIHPLLPAHPAEGPLAL